MSNENNSLSEGEHLQNSCEASTTTASSSNNSKEEHQTIHGNGEPKNTENEFSQTETNEEQEHFVNIQSDAETEADVVHDAYEGVYSICAGIDADGKTILSEEEVEKKFQELGLAVRTDTMTLQKRAIIRKRLWNQAELNFEKEINLIKSMVNNLRYLCFDSESLELLSVLKKQVDIIHASGNYMSGCAEAYGFVQKEEEMAGAVAIILRRIESIERIQSEMSKSPDLDKLDSKRIQLPPIFGDERQEDRVVRRRSVAALALNGQTKRRASIAIVPRNSLPSDDVNVGQYRCDSSNFSPRNTAAIVDSLYQISTPKSISPLASGDQMHVRSRKESRMGDYGMKYVQDHGNSNEIGYQSDDPLFSTDEDVPVIEKDNSQLSVLRMSASLDTRIRTNSVTSETLNIIDSLRKVVKWNEILIRNSRFQLPQSVHQYVPFLTTWYVVIMIVVVFTSGFFTGFNRCLNFQMLFSNSLVSGKITFGIAVINAMLRWKPLQHLIKTAAFIYACSLYQTLHDRGIDAFLKRLGVQIESYSSHGAPV